MIDKPIVPEIVVADHTADTTNASTEAKPQTSPLKLNQQCANVLGELSYRRKAVAEAELNRKEEKKHLEEHKTKKSIHSQLPDVIDMLKTLGIAFLCGPAGTGKSSLAKFACSEIFKLGDKDPITSGKYAQISFSPDTTSGEMIGRTDVNGNFHESEIVRVFRDGGVILFDEIDDADSSMLIKVNTALANGYLATPVGMVQKSKDTYIVCAANTFGTGPDAMYVGRTRLDAATLDRFCLSTIYVDYDSKLEEDLVSELPDTDKYWILAYTHQIRRAIKEGKMRRVCSTRFVINAASHLKNGKTIDWIKENFTQGWSRAEKARIEKEVDDNPWMVKLIAAQEAKKYAALGQDNISEADFDDFLEDLRTMKEDHKTKPSGIYSKPHYSFV